MSTSVWQDRLVRQRLCCKVSAGVHLRGVAGMMLESRAWNHTWPRGPAIAPPKAASRTVRCQSKRKRGCSGGGAEYAAHRPHDAAVGRAALGPRAEQLQLMAKGLHSDDGPSV